MCSGCSQSPQPPAVKLALVPHGGQAFLCAASGRVLEPLGSGDSPQTDMHEHSGVAEGHGN
jgi:hypothetical protein